MNLTQMTLRDLFWLVMAHYPGAKMFDPPEGGQ